MTAKLIQLRDYQNPRDLAPLHGDIEIHLARSNHVTAVTALIGTAATKYSDPNQNLLVFCQSLCEELSQRTTRR
jgi:hypothetical protein